MNFGVSPLPGNERALSVHIFQPNWHNELCIQYLQTRYKKYVEGLGTEQPNPEVPEGMDWDQYDRSSVYVLVSRGKTFRTGCRLINGRNGQKITVDQSLIRSPNHAEISRTVQGGTGDSEDSLNMLYLYVGVIRHALWNMGYDELYANTRVALSRILTYLFGPQVIEVLGPVNTEVKNGRVIKLVPIRITRSVVMPLFDDFVEARLPGFSFSHLRLVA